MQRIVINTFLQIHKNKLCFVFNVLMQFAKLLEGVDYLTYEQTTIFWSGQIVTTSMPVIQKNKFMGLVAVDSRLKDLFGYADILDPDELSYTFAVNDEGNILLLLISR